MFLIFKKTKNITPLSKLKNCFFIFVEIENFHATAVLENLRPQSTIHIYEKMGKMTSSTAS